MMGDFGCNMSFQLIGTYASLFFTQGMGLSLESWAIIVVLAKIFDAINDPVIGMLVDKRKPSKNGKFRPWIFWASFGIALTTILMFIDIRSFSYAGKFAYALIMYCVWSIAYTAANVPYGSLNAVLTDDLSQRASLSSLRSIGAGIAMLPVMIILPKIVYDSKTAADGTVLLKPDVFIWVAIVMGAVGLVGFMLTYFLTKERSVPPEKAEKYELKKALKDFVKNRPALGMCLASLFQLAFFMTLQTTMSYVFQVYFKNVDMMIIGTLAIAAPMVVFIPFMGKLTRRFGKKEMSTWPLLISIAAFAIMLIIPFPKNAIGEWLFIVLVAIGFGASGIFTLATWSIVADAVDYHEYKTGRREEGTVYSIYSFMRKIGQAIAQGAVALLIAAVGFDPNNVAATTDATANGILKLSILLPLIGAILMFLAMLFIYNLDKQKTIEISQALKRKHYAAENGLSEDAPEVIFLAYADIDKVARAKSDKREKKQTAAA